MYVLVDIEWVTNKRFHHCPTQISALKVNEKWETIDSFSALICPRDESFHQWGHAAYNGRKPDDFLRARAMRTVLWDFTDWLEDDDILCWWRPQSGRMFALFCHFANADDLSFEECILNRYIYMFLHEGKYLWLNADKLCSLFKIRIPLPLHNADNEVVIMQRLLQGIHFPQELLSSPSGFDEQLITHKNSVVYTYLYDTETKLLHNAGCEELSKNKEHIGYEGIMIPLVKHLKPCHCCKAEYKEALKAKNEHTIARSSFKYIFVDGSGVFHTRTCPHPLRAKEIRGTEKYKTCIKYGLRPCKHCLPTPIMPAPKEETMSTGADANRYFPFGGLNHEEEKALGRQRRAKEERENASRQGKLEGESRQKIMKLTQPGYAFWAGYGHKTFHSRNCRKISGLTELKGFALYEDAENAGFRPCKICKPTPKQNALISIPIYSEQKAGEDVNTLKTLCQENGFIYQFDGTCFTFQTAVGKWRVNTMVRPVRLEHINLTKNNGNLNDYHMQPRVFLSLEDTFTYIIQHDTSLMLSLEEKAVLEEC